MKVLSKSRFKVGLECPNKLYYHYHKDIYPSNKNDDSFLESLAQGGFQVEELARMHYPEGILIDNPHYDYEGAANRTGEYLKMDNVVVFEAAFLWNDLFIRTDILVKKGNSIELIEVKAKLFDPNDEYVFVGRRGGLVSSWKPYLFDLAFQTYVVKNAYPDLNITSSLMMADKNKTATVDGLNQMFRIPKKGEGDQRTDIVKKVNSLEETGDSVLSKVDLHEITSNILNDKYEVIEGYSFEDSIDFLKKTYQSGEYPNWPTAYSKCKNCEFRATSEQMENGLKSGFFECMKRQHHWNSLSISKPNIFEIWNFRSRNIETLFNENRLFMDQLSEEDLNPELNPNEISSSERRWIQVEKAVSEDNSIHFLKDELFSEMESWRFPLHFIDFETSAVALPFTKGRRPYEQVAFQFSHHTVDENGSIKHQTEFLNASPGLFPNFEFARSLKKALINDNGSVFRFASHENTILNVIISQLEESEESDKYELIEFLKHISSSSNNSHDQWEGERDMIDLRKVIMKFYYNPYTKGSNSIKYLLPAAIKSSDFLKEKYSQPIQNIGLSSKNFSEDHIWFRPETDEGLNPYVTLPPLFEEWDEEKIGENISGLESIADGGMALTAYAKLQYVDMSTAEREELESGLKKYCELDTLAMVMIYEHLKEITH
ncbi:DUF2779 domain-containing protein [Algoriphagus formosus]|uniref:DUF2779 domain-containing protein n=1 Tax=Algoriphagus formosus TaxID=2007308 RepID=UPI000C2891BE|nr:DUF2779 domain-containing protein [Algoriphagus formosus]